jgi:hypothetical protein
MAEPSSPQEGLDVVESRHWSPPLAELVSIPGWHGRGMHVELADGRTARLLATEGDTMLVDHLPTLPRHRVERVPLGRLVLDHWNTERRMSRLCLHAMGTSRCPVTQLMVAEVGGVEGKHPTSAGAFLRLALALGRFPIVPPDGKHLRVWSAPLYLPNMAAWAAKNGEGLTLLSRDWKVTRLRTFVERKPLWYVYLDEEGRQVHLDERTFSGYWSALVVEGPEIIPFLREYLAHRYGPAAIRVKAPEEDNPRWGAALGTDLCAGALAGQLIGYYGSLAHGNTEQEALWGLAQVLAAQEADADDEVALPG